MRKPRKGDRLVYTGPYAPGVNTRYGVGVVVGFRDYRQTVVVELEDDGLWAFWPAGEVAYA